MWTSGGVNSGLPGGSSSSRSNKVFSNQRDRRPSDKNNQNLIDTPFG